MLFKNKSEVISLKDFMSSPAASIQKEKPLQTSIYSIFPVITIGDFFPIQEPGFALFFISTGIIAAIALCEKWLAMNGFTDISGNISRMTSVLFPVVSYGALFWFLFFGMRG
ncbi:hypothetical protein [Metabacillus litoralis]|uniref:hypothetical protein n=1 Tax=Metabacillus litoralis TaxID=152268 RepID=UPI00203AF474|nr:hypothetical protein [Metabacillus litoralis]MCM3411210.1 hypothetical protein [Metabacillus litoralis]